MQEKDLNHKVKRKYRKENDFKINIIFNERGEDIEHIIERAFENYIMKNI